MKTFSVLCLVVGVVKLLSQVQLLATPWTAACQASLSLTIFQSLPKFISNELVVPFNHLILCYPFLLLSIFPTIRVFSNQSAVRIRWPEYWSFSFSISSSKEFSGLISLRLTGLISLLSKGLSRVFITTVRKHQFCCARPLFFFLEEGMANHASILSVRTP